MNAPITPPKFDGFRPDRLWSLWEMLEFNASDFYKVTTAMQHTLTRIEARNLKSIEEHPDGSVTHTPLDDPIFLKLMVERGDELKTSLAVLGAPITAMAVDELRAALTSRYPSYEALRDGYRDITTTLKRELTQVKLLALDAKEQRWFDPPEPLFGIDFLLEFHSASFELDEAAKCLGLGRPTASVFHLMRLMEAGIIAVARCLSIPDPIKPAERNWAIILKAVWAGIERRWPNTADRVHGDGALFEELHASLDAVKNPWRNPTMHVEKKYTDDEAEHIFAAVKGFMMKLASRMDEDGKPLA